MQRGRVKVDIRALSTLHKVIRGARQIDRQMVFLGSVITGDNLDIYFRLRRPLHRLPFPPSSRGGKSAESIIIPDVAYDPGESDSSFSLSPFTPLALFSVWLREALRIRKPTKGKRQSKKVVPQILVKGLPTEERQILNMNIKSGRASRVLSAQTHGRIIFKS